MKKIIAGVIIALLSIFVPVAAQATNGPTNSETVCTAPNPNYVPATEGYYETVDNPDYVPAVPEQVVTSYIKWNWTGGPVEVAPVFPGEGWHQVGPTNDTKGDTPDVVHQGNGKASYFYYETVVTTIPGTPAVGEPTIEVYHEGTPAVGEPTIEVPCEENPEDPVLIDPVFTNPTCDNHSGLVRINTAPNEGVRFAWNMEGTSGHSTVEIEDSGPGYILLRVTARNFNLAVMNITASKDGRVLDQWIHYFSAPSCVQAEPPVFVNHTCDAMGTVTIPSVEGVKYYQNAGNTEVEPGTYTVHTYHTTVFVEARDLDGNRLNTWTFQYSGAPKCDDPETPEKPEMPVTPEKPETPKPDDKNTVTPQTPVVDNNNQVTELAKTGQSDNMAFVAAIAIIALGAGVVMQSISRKRKND